MRTISALWLAVVLSLCLASTTFAHGLSILGGGSPKESAAELAAIFGDHATFSAVVRVAEKDVSASAPRIRELRYYFADGKLRVEEAAVKNSKYSPEELQERRLKGTDR